MTARFVILEHDHPQLHWDLMLEVGDGLLTWRLEAIPVVGQLMDAMRLADHRLLYLDYEGPISGNRGTVQRWDGGEFTWLEQMPTRFIVSLRGEKTYGILTVQQGRGDRWEVRLDR